MAERLVPAIAPMPPPGRHKARSCRDDERRGAANICTGPGALWRSRLTTQPDCTDHRRNSRRMSRTTKLPQWWCARSASSAASARMVSINKLRSSLSQWTKAARTTCEATRCRAKRGRSAYNISAMSCRCAAVPCSNTCCTTKLPKVWRQSSDAEAPSNSSLAKACVCQAGQRSNMRSRTLQPKRWRAMALACPVISSTMNCSCSGAKMTTNLWMTWFACGEQQPSMTRPRNPSARVAKSSLAIRGKASCTTRHPSQDLASDHKLDESHWTALACTTASAAPRLARAASFWLAVHGGCELLREHVWTARGGCQGRRGGSTTSAAQMPPTGVALHIAGSAGSDQTLAEAARRWQRGEGQGDVSGVGGNNALGMPLASEASSVQGSEGSTVESADSSSEQAWNRVTARSSPDSPAPTDVSDGATMASCHACTCNCFCQTDAAGACNWRRLCKVPAPAS
mmetsp:Transcript_4796/g.13296  ORF Transcript_4796/g.13296 Transcript_4796/m.13296 type:complete len:456 (-) Transcript_4796:254-1621(-)